MTLAMRHEDWLGFLRREYLDGFIKAGGAATKFCVPLDDSSRSGLYEELRKQAAGLGYLLAEINSGDTRVDLIEHVFFRVAEQIQWERLAVSVLTTVCETNGFEVPETTDQPFYEATAERNRMAPKAALMLLREKLTDHVFRRSELAKDFRVAMLRMCLAQLTGGQDGAVASRILSDWLTGRNRNVSAVKPYSIFNKINRSNARHMVESLFQWVRIAGYPGLIVVIDIGRVSVSKNPKDDIIFYTTRALLDVYELLREFIDSMDRLVGSLLVVVPDAAFLDEDNLGRGIGRYAALKFRIYDEIRAIQLVNPMATLVRLATNTGDEQ